MFPRGTTPTLTLTFRDETLDLTAANHVYVTFDGGGRTLTKVDSELSVSARQIGVFLTQEESLGFIEGQSKVQANWTYSDGRRGGSKPKPIEVGEQLLGRVLP